MFLVSAPGDEGDFHVGERRAGEGSDMLLRTETGYDEPLEVRVELFGVAVARVYDAAPALSRFDHELDFGVVPERFVVPDA